VWWLSGVETTGNDERRSFDGRLLKGRRFFVDESPCKNSVRLDFLKKTAILCSDLCEEEHYDNIKLEKIIRYQF